MSEWRETLQLLRTLARDFQALRRRPSWVSNTANNTVHFDQFLHGYYYHYALKSVEEGDGMAKVGKLFATNRTRSGDALAEAVDWWCSLPKAPSGNRYDEEIFIRDRGPRLAELFSAEGLDTMREDSFIEGLRSVAAFREHARQVSNITYGLPVDHRESEDERHERFARLVWQSRNEAGRGPVDVITFVVHGTKPLEAEHRLWLAQRDPLWKVRGLGKSILGEILGGQSLTSIPRETIGRIRLCERSGTTWSSLVNEAESAQNSRRPHRRPLLTGTRTRGNPVKFTGENRARSR